MLKVKKFGVVLYISRDYPPNMLYANMYAQAAESPIKSKYEESFLKQIQRNPASIFKY